MFNLSRYVTLGSVVRNFGLTKKLFASTSVLAEKQDPTDPQKPQEILKSSKSKNFSQRFVQLVPNVLIRCRSNCRCCFCIA